MSREDVQSFYERMPYPAPLTSLDKDLAALRDPRRRRVRSLQMFPAGRPSRRHRILVAGCGTSQAAKVAIREPDADVTAIDISRTSLDHLRALQRRHSLENLELRKLSILDARSLGRTFDQIICTGVLHHLPDPDLGLRALRDVLAPDGAMQIMVYASYGRAGIYMMQDFCRRLGIGPTKPELATLAEALKHLPDDHPLTPLLHRAKDFAHPDALADALLHPQDRAYTVPQIYEWLDRCGMSFGRWLEQAPYLPRCGALARSPHAARIAELPEREQHAAVELFRGSITQHSFVAYRDDRPGDPQPIRFSGESWRTYVPVGMPWMKVFRERLPAGAAAVLLNPVHRHADLFLPIDAVEEAIFARIDGTRSIGQIEEHCNEKVAARLPAFFRTLWEHDLITIDASDGQCTGSVDRDSFRNPVAREPA